MINFLAKKSIKIFSICFFLFSEKEIKDNSNLSTPHQTFDYTQNTLSILNKTLNQRKYYANVMKKDVTNSVFDVFDDINRKESFCSLGIFIKYKLNWSKSLSSSPTVPSTHLHLLFPPSDALSDREIDHW